MTVRRGKKHDYLGPNLDFSEECNFIVDMEEYLSNILSGFPEDTNEVATAPVSDHLFKIHNNARNPDKERTDLFQCVTT